MALPRWDDIAGSESYKKLEGEDRRKVFMKYKADLADTPVWGSLGADEKFKVVRQMEKDGGFYEPTVLGPSPLETPVKNITDFYGLSGEPRPSGERVGAPREASPPLSSTLGRLGEAERAAAAGPSPEEAAEAARFGEMAKYTEAGLAGAPTAALESPLPEGVIDKTKAIIPEERRELTPEEIATMEMSELEGLAPIEAPLAVASSLAGGGVGFFNPIPGLVGLSAGFGPGEGSDWIEWDLDRAVEGIHKTQEFFYPYLTYQARTAGGQRAQGLLDKFLEVVIVEPTTQLGGGVTDIAQGVGLWPEVAAGIGTAVKVPVELAAYAVLFRGLGVGVGKGRSSRTAPVTPKEGKTYETQLENVEAELRTGLNEIVAKVEAKRADGERLTEADVAMYEQSLRILDEARRREGTRGAEEVLEPTQRTHDEKLVEAVEAKKRVLAEKESAGEKVNKADKITKEEEVAYETAREEIKLREKEDAPAIAMAKEELVREDLARAEEEIASAEFARAEPTPGRRGASYRVTEEGEIAREVAEGGEPVRSPSENIAGLRGRLGERREAYEVLDAAREEPYKPAYLPGEKHIKDVEAMERGGELIESDPSAVSNPIRREAILKPLAEALRTTFYHGRIKKKNVAGFFRHHKEEIRLKKLNDMETAAHEAAHLLEDRVPGLRRAWQGEKNSEVLETQLREVSYDRTDVSEGFAEFLRLWMSQKEKARENAPDFYDWWEEELGHLEYGPALKKAQKDIHSWFEQGHEARGASKIGEHSSLFERFRDATNDINRQAISDDLAGVYRMERELKGRILEDGAYETMRLTRSAPGKVEGVLEIGRLKREGSGDYTFVEGSKGLTEILKPLKGIRDGLDTWTRYIVGRSARELQQQGREKLLTDSEIRSFLELGEKHPELEGIFQEYLEWQRSIVDFGVDTGVIDPGARATWRRSFYVPFNRVGKGEKGTYKKGVVGDWNGIKFLTGGTQNLRNIMDNIVNNAANIITQGIKNDALGEVVRLAESSRGGGRFLAKIPKDSSKIAVEKKQLEDHTYELFGIKPSEAAAVLKGKIPEGMSESTVRAIEVIHDSYMDHPDFLQFWKHGVSPTGENIIAVMKDGKSGYYEVGDPLVMRAVLALNRPAQKGVVRVLDAGRRFIQTSVTLTADFTAVNLFRDTVQGGVLTRSGYIPFIDALRGLNERVWKGQDYKDYMANGGGFVSPLLSEGAFNRRLQSYYSNKGINFKSVLNTPVKIFNAMEKISASMEMATRIGEYKRARARGKSKRHSSFLGREVSSDFAQRGDSAFLGFFYDTVPFLRARTAGLDRLYRGVLHDPHRGQVAAKTTALAFMSQGIYLANRDNPLFQDLEDWDRDTHWHFYIPNGAYYAFQQEHNRKPATTEEANGLYEHFRLPKTWEIGAVGTMAERVLERFMDDEEEKLGADAARLLHTQLSVSLIPGLLAPPYEQLINKNRFTGRPIEPEYMKDLPPHFRAYPTGSRALREAAIKAGGVTSKLPRRMQEALSPAKVEAILRGYGTTWANYGLMTIDGMLYDDNPEMRVDQYPVIRRFYQGTPAKRTKWETMFYDMLRATTEARRGVREASKKYGPELEAETYKMYQTAYEGWGAGLKGSKEKLSKLRHYTEQVYGHPEWSPDKKRIELNKIQKERNRIYKSSVKGLMALEKAIREEKEREAEKGRYE